MMATDIAKVSRNVRKMVDMGTPEGDIDAYLASEKVSVARIRAYNKTRANYTTTDKAASNFTMGLSDKVGALGQAIGGEIAERLGGRNAPFRERYGDALSATDSAEAAWNERNPVARVAMAPLTIAGAVPGGVATASLGMAARQGAVLSGASGAGASRGSLGEQAGQTALAAGGGAILGPVAMLGGNALANRLAARAARTNADAARRTAVATAAQNQGISVMPADVGGPMVGRITAALDQSPLATNPIRRAAAESIESMEGAVNRTAGNMGNALEPADLGDAVQAGARASIQRTSTIGGQLFTRAEQAAGSATVTPARAVAEIDRSLADLAQNPNMNAASIGALQRIRDDLAVGAKPLQAVRDVRTQVRDAFMNEGLRGADLERRVGLVVRALNDDVTAALANNPTALARYRRADAFWRQRVNTIDNALEKVLGRTGQMSAEATAAKLVQMASARGDSRNLAGILSALPRDVRGDVSATVLTQLGRSGAGAQNAAGDAFSPAVFATNWNKLTPRARASLFPDPAHRQAIQEIATVAADGMKFSQQFANRSNTGSVGFTFGTLGVGAGFGIEAAIATSLAQVAGGRLMASPTVARLLVPVARARTVAQYQAAIAPLQRYAVANPAIQVEINSFIRAANDNMARLAAQGNEGEGQQPQPE
jgi:hypothetical protein